MKHYLINIEELGDSSSKSSNIVNQYQYKKILDIINEDDNDNKDIKDE